MKFDYSTSLAILEIIGKVLYANGLLSNKLRNRRLEKVPRNGSKEKREGGRAIHIPFMICT